MKGKYLITTDNWFFGPNGFQYRAVWGEVTIVEDSFLGIKTNTRATNWYAKVGTEENHVIVAGCQIHYAVKTENEPKQNSIESNIKKNLKDVEIRHNTIYIAK
jgi:hypothetical protein